ncbi:MAG: response regulator, partial [Sulfurimonadaceae bacterium]|nr:response regulator [Sulfurimonadaceae bacterium]
MKIMLVEDEYLLNRTITDYLTSKGYEVDSYTNGLEAFEAIKDNHVLYVLDIDIPEIDGVT